LSVSGVFAVFVSVTTIPILAPLGYSLTAVSHRPRDYLRLKELLSEELVDAASTNARRRAQFMLCTIFLFLPNALNLAGFEAIRGKLGREFSRCNLEQFREFVKYQCAKMIRPEEKTIHAGDPT